MDGRKLVTFPDIRRFNRHGEWACHLERVICGVESSVPASRWITWLFAMRIRLVAMAKPTLISSLKQVPGFVNANGDKQP